MSIMGKIHSIETLGTLDGPGIRYVVFMQGCPLRCIYCHNRDTWDIDNGREVTSDDIVNDLKEYIDFIKVSNGGITITGGEPTLQSDFVTEVFKECKNINVHTALDTSGYTDIDKVKELLKYTDLVILDLKHANNQKHKEITGIENIKILEFADYVSLKGIKIWIRHVLIPGYTDNFEDIRELKTIINNLKTVEKVEVLPFHKMGEYKWEALNKEYVLKDTISPSKEEVETVQKFLTED